MKEMEKEQMSQDELKRMRRMSYIKMAAMVGLVIAIIAFGSIAWFTMNREVEGTGMRMSSTRTGFELRTSGADSGSVYLTLLERLTQSGQTEDVYKNGVLKGNNTFQTSDDYSEIVWRLEDGKESTEDLAPNSSGVLEFYIVPDGSLSTQELMNSVHFSLAFKAYVVSEYQKDNSGEFVLDANNNKIPTELTDINDLSGTDKDEALKGLQYLKGHILFFKEPQSLGQSYKGLLDTANDLRLSDVQSVVQDDGSIKVTLYWKWADTFPELICHSGTILSSDTATQNALRQYVVEHADSVLKDETAKAVSQNEAIDTTNVLLSKFGANTTLVDLSRLYNRADSEIGSTLDYALIVLNASAE